MSSESPKYGGAGGPSSNQEPTAKRSKVTVRTIREMKQRGERITSVTA